MKRRCWLPFVLVAVLPYLWVLNCSGPRPELEGLRVQAPIFFGGAYQLSATVRNSGPGHGQIALTFTLRANDTGRTYEKSDTVTLQAGETAVITESIQAPRGTYTPQVQIAYPPG